MSQPTKHLLLGSFRIFQGANGAFVDTHETRGMIESRQNIPIALFLAARVLLQVAEGLDLHLLKQAIHGRIRRAEHIAEVAILLAGALHHPVREGILGNAFRGKMG